MLMVKVKVKVCTFFGEFIDVDEGLTDHEILTFTLAHHLKPQDVAVVRVDHHFK